MAWQARLAARLVGSVGSLLYLALPNGVQGEDNLLGLGWQLGLGVSLGEHHFLSKVEE